MRTPPLRLIALLLLPLLLTVPAGPAIGQAAPPDDRPVMAGEAVSLLPPGNSGFVSVDGQAQGTAGGSYGANTDDQTPLYWGLEGYAGQGFADPADAVRTEVLLDGAVRVYWDRFGVPSIHADTGRDVWYGAGYAVAQIRLFLMDAVRRQGRGTFAALVGPSGVPLDVQTRTLTYSEAEYEAMADRLSPEARDAFEGYVEGANAWIEQVNADPSLLPVEYVLLSTRPEPLDLVDVLAAGVLITRTVAAEGGNEMDNVRLLRQLEDDLGVAAGRGVFDDLVWQDDPLAVTTVPGAEGTFPNSPLSGDAQAGSIDAAAAFEAAADYAATLPLELADGPGTGAHPEPETVPSGAPDPGAALAAQAGAALADWAAAMHGGSIAVALGPGRTAAGNAMVLSGPQLGYSYPSLLVELEVHGGGYDARGASVPALPTVGIGYTDRVGWALTTGYSKTIDSFVETVRDNPTDGGPLQYRHDGEWLDADCRTEVVEFREGAMGAPATPALRSESIEVCRTVHGPIVSQQAGTGERLARSVQYQMFDREVDTVEGVLGWNRADDLADFAAAMRLVSWNENTTYADADGHIAYWHPGIHRERPAWDLRFPLPGDGSVEFGEPLPFEALPHVVDPAQGFIANWNNKPALGWLDGEGIGPTSRPGGAVQRVSTPIALAASRRDHTFASLQDLEVEAGLTDPRAAAFLPVLLDGLAGSTDPRHRVVAELLAGWNGRFYDPPGAPETFRGPGGTSSVEDGTDGPAPTVFEAVLEALLADVFGPVWGGRITDPDAAAACNGGSSCPDLVSRQLGVGSHRYDASPAHNLLLRVLDPSSSGLVPSRDWLRGRSVADVVREAVDSAMDGLAAEYGSTIVTRYRRDTHSSQVDSLTGVTGPSSTQPYMDRGSYIHVASFDPPAAITPERAAGSNRVLTSVASSALAFPEGAAAVVVAAAGSYPDALLSSPLAGLLEAPLLLVDGSVVPEALAEVERLGAPRAVVVGNASSVPESVVGQLEAAGLVVQRLAGADPFEVAAAVADEVAALRDGPVGEGSPDAYVVSADHFADALSISGVAARTGVPILMVRTEEVPPATQAALQRLGAQDVTVVGGTAVVSQAVAAALPGGGRGPAARLAGSERYGTAAAVLAHARGLGLSFDALVLATGANFPDGLTGGAVAAALDGVVVPVDGLVPERPGEALGVALSQRAVVERIIALGGTAVIAEDLLQALAG